MTKHHTDIHGSRLGPGHIIHPRGTDGLEAASVEPEPNQPEHSAPKPPLDLSHQASAAGHPTPDPLDISPAEMVDNLEAEPTLAEPAAALQEPLLISKHRPTLARRLVKSLLWGLALATFIAGVALVSIYFYQL